jgi:hypothetical protein
MQIHVFVALAASPMLHETRSTALNLDTTPSFLLDMLNISTPVTNNLSTKVETWDWFEIYWDFLLGPFALLLVSNFLPSPSITYSAKFISLDLIRLSSAESSLID